MVLAGCEYNGPSVDEISDSVVGKMNDPTAGEITDNVFERQGLLAYSNSFEQLANYGKLTVSKGIQAWGQTDAAYTLAVNTAEREGFNLSSNSAFTWEGNGNADIKRSGNSITLAEKSNGKSASFNFTITDNVTKKTVKGALTITTNYDNSTVGVSNLNEFFEYVLSYGLDYDTATFNTVKPITQWGQTDAAYTITADTYNTYSIRIYSPNSAPVLFDQNSYDWEKASVEWKPPVLGDLTASFGSGYPSSESLYIGGNRVYLWNYSGIYYELSTTSTTVKQAKFEFRITRNDQTISGTVTVNIKAVTKTPEQIQQETEKAQLEYLRSNFNSSFSLSSNNISYGYGGVISRFIDKDITAFGQTDVLYTISVKGGNDNYDYNNGNYVYYSFISLPTSYPSTITWTTKTANAAVVLDGGTQLKVYQNQTGTAEFEFTYTYTFGGTVKGSVKVTVVK